MSESTFKGSPGIKPYGGIKTNNPLITQTPWLFMEAFEGLDKNFFLDFAEAGLFFGLASVIFDHLVDGQFTNPGLAILLHQAIFQLGARIYRKLFPSNAPFWLQYDRLTKEHIISLSKDVATQVNLRGLNLEDFAASASGKVSPMLIAVAAMAEAVDNPSLLQPIESS